VANTRNTSPAEAGPVLALTLQARRSKFSPNTPNASDLQRNRSQVETLLRGLRIIQLAN